MKNLIFLILIISSTSLFTSCATLLNGSNKEIIVHTPRPARVHVDSLLVDTNDYRLTHHIIVPRATKPLSMVVEEPQDTAVINIKPRISTTVWLNALTFYAMPIGFAIDGFSNEKWTYPSNIYIDSFQKNKYSTKYYEPELFKYKHILKWNLLRMIDGTNPSFDLAYERMYARNWSTQYSLGMLINSYRKFDIPQGAFARGYRTSVEQRYYYANYKSDQYYVGLNLEFLNKKNYEYYDFIDKNLPYDIGNALLGVKVLNHTRFLNISSVTGYQIHYHRIVFDMYMGFGIRINYTDLIGNPGEDFRRFYDDRVGLPIISEFEDSHNRIGVHIPLGIRIGFKLY